MGEAIDYYRYSVADELEHIDTDDPLYGSLLEVKREIDAKQPVGINEEIALRGIYICSSMDERFKPMQSNLEALVSWKQRQTKN